MAAGAAITIGRAAEEPLSDGTPPRGRGAQPCHATCVDSSPPRVDLELDTSRLRLRRWTASDTSWHRYLVEERGGGLPSAEEDAVVIAGLLDSARAHGVAPSVVVRKHDDAVLGYCGLIVGRSSIAEPELAFELFARDHGQGYATEAAAAVVQAAERTGRARLWSTVRTWNAPSFRVLQKLGFRREHSVWDDRGELVWNSLDLASQ